VVDTRDLPAPRDPSLPCDNNSNPCPGNFNCVNGLCVDPDAKSLIGRECLY
jgi:hypothetical protein